MCAALAFADDDLPMPRRRHLYLAAVDGCVVDAGTSTSIEYGFGSDRSGATQFQTTVRDANGKTKESYRDVRELITSVAEHNKGATLWTSYGYLQARGLDSTEAVEHFKLGYANRTLGLRLPEKKRLAGAEIRTRLQKIGIYRESGHEHFNGSLIVTVLNEHGNAVEVCGRKIRDYRKALPFDTAKAEIVGWPAANSIQKLWIHSFMKRLRCGKWSSWSSLRRSSALGSRWITHAIAYCAYDCQPTKI